CCTDFHTVIAGLFAVHCAHPRFGVCLLRMDSPLLCLSKPPVQVDCAPVLKPWI
ncbi:hypothetical protein BaRGS_00001137, partial [Batillaria attramentaria]